MPRIPSKAEKARGAIPGVATRAPLGGLSCPYCSRDAAGPADEDPRWQSAFHADYWNPPTSKSQYARQRILAVIVAFILAAILVHARW